MANEGLNTLAWVSIFAGVVVTRFATRGRGLTEIPGDVSDLTIAAVSGGNVAEVLARRSSVEDAAEPSVSTTANVFVPGNTSLVSAVRSLGGKARGYRLGATGPDYYDCSGLVWAGMKSLGYSGPRFVTASFVNGAPQGLTYAGTGTPQSGDIVVWPIQSKVGHMGVATDSATVYSALSVQSGIKSLPIATLNKQKGYAPSIYRWSK